MWHGRNRTTSLEDPGEGHSLGGAGLHLVATRDVQRVRATAQDRRSGRRGSHASPRDVDSTQAREGAAD